MNVSISAIPAFNDNYIWLITHADSAWVVDPGDSQPVIDALNARKLTLAGILLTHHHGDHTGGVQALKQQFPQAHVIGNGDSPAAHLTEQSVSDGDTVELLGQRFQVLAVPGHTLDHLAYFCADLEALFCGDTLFVGGCGRVFEGTHQQMFDSLQRLAALPASTKVYCAHEYTVSNLRFAVAAQPDNLAAQSALQDAETRRAHGQITVPSTLQRERETNPFLTANDLATFSARREWKNNF